MPLENKVVIPLIIGVVIVSAIALGVYTWQTPPIPTSLLGKKWILKTFVFNNQQVSLIANRELTIKFDQEGEVSGYSGCNNFFAAYEIGGYSTKGSSTEGDLSIGPIAHTEMACLEEGVMEQETMYLTALGEVTTFQVTSDELQLSSEGKQTVLIFVAETQ